MLLLALLAALTPVPPSVGASVHALRAAVPLSGRVLDAHGAPAAGVRVLVGELGHATLLYTTPREMFVSTPGIADAERARYAAELRTDAEGRFAVEGLAPGDFALVAATDEAVALVETRLSEARVQLEIALRPAAFVEGTLRGRAYDRSLNTLELKPVSGTGNVQLTPRLQQAPGGWDFRSGALPDVGAWRLIGTQVVLEQDYRGTLFDVPVQAAGGRTTRVDLRLDGGLALAGRVLGPGGEPLALVSVVARAASPGALALGTITDARGEFRLQGLSAGAWQLDARRWKLRELVGCGNGREELQTALGVVLPRATPEPVELRLAAFTPVPRVGDVAPEFSVRTVAGAELSLAALRGKVVLLDFWATWCGLCRLELPRLCAGYEALAPGGGFEIVGVSVDEDPELVRRFALSRGLRWPQTALGVAAQNPIARRYNVNSTPATVLIDRQGKIAALDLTGAELRQKIEQLLALK